jgi:hypothetical protein
VSLSFVGNLGNVWQRLNGQPTKLTVGEDTLAEGLPRPVPSERDQLERRKRDLILEVRRAAVSSFFEYGRWRPDGKYGGLGDLQDAEGCVWEKRLGFDVSVNFETESD